MRPEVIVFKALFTFVIAYVAALVTLGLTALLGPLLARVLQSTRPCVWLRRRMSPDPAPLSNPSWGGGYVHGFMFGLWVMLWLAGSVVCAIFIWDPRWLP